MFVSCHFQNRRIMYIVEVKWRKTIDAGIIDGVKKKLRAIRRTVDRLALGHRCRPRCCTSGNADAAGRDIRTLLSSFILLCNLLSPFTGLCDFLSPFIGETVQTCQIDGQETRVKRNFKHLVNHAKQLQPSHKYHFCATGVIPVI